MLMQKKISKTLKSEIEAAIIIGLLAIGVFFLPNHTIDPWELFNPQRLGLIILLIASMQFGGYFAIRLLGNKIGIALVGFFGGFVSSTVVFLTLPKIYKQQKELLYPTIAAAILATVGMLIEFLVILYNLSTDLFNIFFYPLFIMMIVGAIFTLFLTRGKDKRTTSLEKINPLDLKSSLKLAVWLFSMLIIITLTIQYMGTKSAALISFFAGLFELHGVSIATATLFIQQKLSLYDAKLLLLLALCGAFTSKFLIVSFLSRSRFALLTSLFLSIMLIAGLAGFYSASVFSSITAAPLIWPDRNACKASLTSVN